MTTIEEIIARYGLRFDARRMHTKEAGPIHKVGLAWSVEITNAGGARYVTPYSAGILAANLSLSRAAEKALHTYPVRICVDDANEIEEAANRAKPKPTDVLAALVNDAESIDGYSLSEFSRELCDGLDAFEALRVYQACEAARDALRNLIPDHKARAELAEIVREL